MVIAPGRGCSDMKSASKLAVNEESEITEVTDDGMDTGANN